MLLSTSVCVVATHHLRDESGIGQIEPVQVLDQENDGLGLLAARADEAPHDPEQWRAGLISGEPLPVSLGPI